MSNGSSASPCESLSLAQPVFLVLYQLLAVWVSSLLKLSSALTSAVRAAPAPRKGAELTAEDLAVVLERIGIGAGGEGGVHGVDVSSVFDQEEPTMEEAKAAFDVFDSNGDGYIDAAELQRVLAVLGCCAAGGAEVSECQRMIAVHDANADGRIDFGEFVKFLEASSF